MSLKAFHIAFVILTTVTSLFVGGWGFHQYFRGGGGGAELAMGVGGVVFAVAMVIYGRYVLRKLRNISYL